LREAANAVLSMANATPAADDDEEVGANIDVDH
jgi:hypothetical protein